MQKFRLDWNYHSNNLEGNSLTYGETKALILFGITAQGKPKVSELRDSIISSIMIKYLSRIQTDMSDLSKTILVADDSESVRHIVEIMLKNSGYKVITAEDGREALKVVFETDVDVVIADSMMPNLTGNELFRILRTDPEKKKIPMIILSGLAREHRSESEIRYADDFVEKGNHMREDLLAAIRKVTGD